MVAPQFEAGKAVAEDKKPAPPGPVVLWPILLMGLLGLIDTALDLRGQHESPGLPHADAHGVDALAMHSHLSAGESRETARQVEELIHQNLGAEKAFDLVLFEWRQQFAAHAPAPTSTALTVATTDELTGAWTRTFGLAQVSHELERAHRAPPADLAHDQASQASWKRLVRG